MWLWWVVILGVVWVCFAAPSLVLHALLVLVVLFVIMAVVEGLRNGG